MTPGPGLRLLLVDDHYIVRLGLASLLGKEPDLHVVAEAADGDEALLAYREYRPDVVLMDVRMPGRNGVAAVELIRAEFPAARILMLTTYDGDEDIHRALQAGASGYLLKDSAPVELLTGIRTVAAGQCFLPPAVQARLNERNPESTLTPRELEVLQLVTKGMHNREIGTILGFTENTAKWHLKNILRKLEVADRTEATAAALQRGILHLEE